MSELDPQIQQKPETEAITLGDRVRSGAARVGLSFLLSTGAGVGVSTAHEVADAGNSPAEATTDFVNDYPNMGAQATGAQYEWWVDENGDGKPYITPSSTDNDETVSSRGYYYRNCTDGASYWTAKYTGVDPSGWGDAATWNEAAVRKGYEVKLGSSNTIEIGDIAQSDDKGYGHVGFVTGVTKNSAGAITTVNIAELNYNGKGDYRVYPYTVRNASQNFVIGSTMDWDHFIDVNGSGKGLNNETITGDGGGGGTGKVSYASVADGQEFYSEEGWVYTKVGGAAFPIEHKNDWSATDTTTWGNAPLGPVSNLETHDHEAGYNAGGYRSVGEHPPRDGTAVYVLGGNGQQYYFKRGKAFDIGMGEVDDLGVRNRAMPIPSGRLDDFTGYPFPISNGEVYRAAGLSRVNQYVIDPNGIRSYHVNNDTVKECLRAVYGHSELVIPQSAALRLWAPEVDLPAACSFPSGFVMRGLGGLEQWRIEGDNSSQAYRRRYYQNALTVYLNTSGNPHYEELQNVSAINSVTQGPDMDIPNGVAFYLNGSGQQFYAENGLFRPIPWPEMDKCLGINSIFGVPDNVAVALPQGTQMSCTFENKILARPDGRAYYVEGGRSHYIGNAAVRDCITGRRGTGSWVGVANSTVDSYVPSTPAYCNYEGEAGLNFVQEQGDPTVWLVRANGIKQHVGSLCVSDPYTTGLKNYHVWTVPSGETAGHTVGADFWASGAACDELPKP